MELFSFESSNRSVAVEGLALSKLVQLLPSTGKLPVRQAALAFGLAMTSVDKANAAPMAVLRFDDITLILKIESNFSVWVG